MLWTVCMCISIALFAAAVTISAVSALSRHKIRHVSRFLFFGVILSSVVMFYPCYVSTYEGMTFGWAKTILACIHHTIRLFVVDGEMTFLTDSVGAAAPEWIVSPYIALGSVLFLAVPVCTFGFILSFFKSVSSSVRYVLGRGKERYLFSDVNERSLCLAEDLRARHPRAQIVFTSADEKDLDADSDTADRLRKIGAICFRRDILSIDLKRGKRAAAIFLLSEQEDDNVRRAAVICGRCGDRSNLSLYVDSFSADDIGLLGGSQSAGQAAEIKIRRVNDVYLPINRFLYQEGHRIFESAQCVEGDEEKVISALVVGLGKRGSEMLRALVSFCQMDGYRPLLTAVDLRENAGAQFEALCPELTDERHNGDFTTPGEAHYRIGIHSGVDVTTKAFADLLTELSPVTFVFVALGDDALNISAAKNIRMLCERAGSHPLIRAFVEDPVKAKLLTDGAAGRYDIGCIGDVRSRYTEENVVACELENAALRRHLKWGDEKSFWSSEYNYRSSIASIIHQRMKRFCGIPQVDLPPQERGERERTALRMLEHRRWNAYMRSEGYVYGERRDHLMKTHPDLKPFCELDPAEIAKDDD